METSEAMMPPAKLLTGDAVASDGSRERPVEDLRVSIPVLLAIGSQLNQ